VGSDGPVKFQLACVDDIIDENGIEIPEVS